MKRDPILEIVTQPVSVSSSGCVALNNASSATAIEAHLRRADVRTRITTRSLQGHARYIELLVPERLSADTPDPCSVEMWNGLVIGKENWAHDLLRLLFFSRVLLIAAHVGGSDEATAAVCRAGARLYFRIGMYDLGRAVSENGLRAAENAGESTLQVALLLEIAKHFLTIGQPGRALGYAQRAASLNSRGSTDSRAQHWQTLADIYEDMNRYDDASECHRTIAAMPEARVMPPDRAVPVVDGRPVASTLAEWHEQSANGLNRAAATANILTSPFASLWEGAPAPLYVDSPEGSLIFFSSSLHEQLDALERKLAQVVSVRGSISHRRAGASYLRAWSPIVEAAVDTALAVALPHRALELYEQFKSVTLLRRMAMALGPCPAGVPPGEWSRLKDLIDAYRTAIAAEDEERIGDSANMLSVARLEELIVASAAHLRSSYQSTPDRLALFGTSKPRQRLRPSNLPAATSVVEFFVGRSRCGMWVKSGSSTEIRWLSIPQVDRTVVLESARAVEDALLRWSKGVAAGFQPHTLKGVQLCLSTAAERLMSPVLESMREAGLLEGVDHLVMIPATDFGRIPLHLATLEQGITASYAPSFSYLSHASQGATTDAPLAVVVSDPLGDSVSSSGVLGRYALPAARLEGRLVAASLVQRGFRVEAAEGRRATQSWIEHRISGASIIHIAAHGKFHPEDSSKSALLLAGDNIAPERSILGGSDDDGDEDWAGIGPWTLDRIWQSVDLSTCQLVFLAGCQTSMVQADEPVDELLGLVGGFIQAGARAVVGSLWPVGDLPTLLVTQRFYEELGPGCGPPQALHRAQSWLRESTTETIATRYENLIREYLKLETGEAPESPGDALRRWLSPGDREGARPFALPAVWGAFRCLGG